MRQLETFLNPEARALIAREKQNQTQKVSKKERFQRGRSPRWLQAVELNESRKVKEQKFKLRQGQQCIFQAMSANAERLHDMARSVPPNRW